VVQRAPDPPQPDGRRKGGDALAVFRRTPAGQVDPVVDGDELHPGDAIRFRVTLARDGYAGVFGVDAAAVVTAYAPLGPTLERLARGTATVLDGSIILDGTLGAEHVVLVVCDAARPVAAIIAAASAVPAPADRVTSDCRETWVRVVKVKP